MNEVGGQNLQNSVYERYSRLNQACCNGNDIAQIFGAIEIFRVPELWINITPIFKSKVDLHHLIKVMVG